MTEKERFPKSVPLESVYSDVTHKPFSIFEETYITDVRKKCLGVIKTYDINMHLADWAEEAVNALQKNGEDDKCLAEDVLKWYVHKSKDELIKRAVEFAIVFTEKNIFCSKVEGEIVGKIIDSMDIYPQIPSVKKFICGLLKKISKARFGNGDYHNFSWISVERALRIINRANDFSFLWGIEEIIMSLEEKIINPVFFGEPKEDTRKMHLARLKIIRNNLLKAKKYERGEA